jgi:hypothetical protein
MIHVRRTAEHASPVFEVVVREGKSETRHVARDVRTTNGGQAHPRALSRGGLPVLARPRTKGIDPQTLRRNGDLALFPRVRAGDAMLPFAVLINTKKSVPDFPRASVVDSLPPDGLALRCAKANLELTSASLIGRSGSSAFRLSTTPVSMSLTGSCFSSDSAPRPFHHGIRRRGGTIFRAALP